MVLRALPVENPIRPLISPVAAAGGTDLSEAESCHFGDRYPFFRENMEGHLTSLVKQLSIIFFPVLEYHDRWKSVTLSELMGKQQNHGMIPARVIAIPVTGWPIRVTIIWLKQREKEEIDAIAMKSLDQFVEICQEAGIQVMFMEMPSANSWNMARHRAVADYASSRNISFIDFNMKDRMKETGFDWMTDSRDGGQSSELQRGKKD